MGTSDLQALVHAQHALVLAAPLERVARRQRKLLRDGRLRAVHVTAYVALARVHVHVPREHPVLVADHGRPLDEPDVRQLLRAVCGRRSWCTRARASAPARLLA